MSGESLVKTHTTVRGENVKIGYFAGNLKLDLYWQKSSPEVEFHKIGSYFGIPADTRTKLKNFVSGENLVKNAYRGMGRKR